MTYSLATRFGRNSHQISGREALDIDTSRPSSPAKPMTAVPSVGMTKFDQMVADRRMAKPKKVDGRVVWDRLKLEGGFGRTLGDEDEIWSAFSLDRRVRCLQAATPCPICWPVERSRIN